MKKKRIVAFLLCALMICSIPFSVLAENEGEENSGIEINTEDALENTEDTEETTTDTEEVVVASDDVKEEEEENTVEVTISEQLLATESVEEMYTLVLNLMQNNPQALKAMSADEIVTLRNRINELDPEGDDVDTRDLLDTLEVLPNGKVTENVVVPELVVGDYDSIIANLDALYEEANRIANYDECIDVYNRLLTVTDASKSNGKDLLVTGQMNEVYSRFYAIRDCLDGKFGYTYRTSDALILNNTISTFSAPRSSSNSSVETSKTVKALEDKENEYLLTLEAYVTGESATITKVKPADIVLVLDQSASMYAPMGASGGKSNKKIYNPSTDENVEQYSEAYFKELSQSADFFSNASHLGYYVAQSTAGSHMYCNRDEHEGKAECKTYDWFIIQYVKNDPEGKVWHFYRVPQTANPSNDSKILQKVDNNWVTSNEAAIWKREKLVCDDVDLGGHSGCLICVLGGSKFNFYKSQYGALYDAISVFGQSVVDQNAGHRLAVATFSAEIEYLRYATGSGIYVNGEYKRYNNKQYYDSESREYFTTWQSIYAADTLTKEEYKSTLMSDSESIMASINAVSTDSYGTNHDVGMDIANKIFEENSVDLDKRDRIVIMFTDGQPSPTSLSAYGNGYKSKSEGMTDAFIQQAYKAKYKYGAQIYTIWTSTLSDDQSAFMKHGSSDYPEAEKLGTYGDPISSPKYASGVKTGEQLLDAFGSVFEDVSSTTVTELKEETVVRDIVAPSFTLPTNSISGWDNMSKDEQMEELASLIKVYEAAYKGKNSFAVKGDEGYKEYDDAQITVSKDEDGLYKIEVTNYDFSGNYVTDLDSGGYRGNKLVIEIPIVAKPDFIGGDNVVTNGKDSGIYASDGSSVEMFPIPEVDIDLLQITPVFQSQDIYISQWANLSTILNLGIFKGENGNSYRIDGINNAYADIVYTIEDPSGFKLTYTIPAGSDYDNMTNLGWSYDESEGNIAPLLTEDTIYKATCKVVSKNDDSNNKCDESSQTVRIFKPVITFKDSAIELGDTPDYDDNFVSVVWEHDGEIASESMGEPPVLEYGYSPKAEAFTELNTPVAVTVTAKTNNQNIPIDQDITQYVTFYRDACNYEDCDHKDKLQVSATDEKRVNFVVHLKSFDLKITKRGADSEKDENQTFMFRVTGPDSFSMDVMVLGNSSVTIKNLPAGEYTVKELTDWSWRYTPEVDSQIASAANAVNGVTTVSFANTRTKPFWLSGDSYCENWWGTTNLKRNPQNGSGE